MTTLVCLEVSISDHQGNKSRRTFQVSLSFFSLRAEERGKQLAEEEGGVEHDRNLCFVLCSTTIH